MKFFALFYIYFMILSNFLYLFFADTVLFQQFNGDLLAKQTSKALIANCLSSKFVELLDEQLLESLVSLDQVSKMSDIVCFVDGCLIKQLNLPNILNKKTIFIRLFVKLTKLQCLDHHLIFLQALQVLLEVMVILMNKSMSSLKIKREFCKFIRNLFDCLY